MDGSSTGTRVPRSARRLRLPHEIGKKELAEWVNHELNGYPDGTELPFYRILQSRVMGVPAKEPPGWWTVTCNVIPARSNMYWPA